jgi:hypothetical protein
MGRSVEKKWPRFRLSGNSLDTITFKGNKVVERKYEVFDRIEDFKAPKLKWVETGKDLGSHKTKGAPVRTVDELYAEAKKVVEMQVPKAHRRELSTAEP